MAAILLTTCAQGLKQEAWTVVASMATDPDPDLN